MDVYEGDKYDIICSISVILTVEQGTGELQIQKKICVKRVLYIVCTIVLSNRQNK